MIVTLLSPQPRPQILQLRAIIEEIKQTPGGKRAHLYELKNRCVFVKMTKGASN